MTTQATGSVPAWSDADFAGSVIGRLERVIAGMPNHLALVDIDGVRLDYRELDAAMRAVAAEIVDRLGRGAGHVALYADLRAEAVIGMLGIVAAGKAYVPIDPAEPPSRTEAKLRSADLRVAVAPPSLAAAAAELFGDERVVVAKATPAGPGADPVPVGPDADFNLIYTSGSTGAPKGVVQNHRNVMFDTAASTGLFPVGPADSFGLIVPLTFGASVSDVAGALLNGAVLDVCDVTRHGIDAMAGWMRDHAITVTHLVPTVFRRWMNVLGPDDRYPAMRMIKAGGEPLLRHDLESFSAHFDEGSILRNGLGTTETYLIAAEMLQSGDSWPDAILPVGFPAPGRSVAVLGEDGNEVAHGEVGQIAVTSRYLSPGYWRDPESTARAYRSDPDDPGIRTYLSGDRGRLRPDGRLEHLGRIDDMVKVMGRRVELSEVETVLLEQPGVAEAAVAARPAPSGDNRLFAYLVADGRLPTPGALRTALAATLPRHMIPAGFIEVDSLPTLPFGKVDRRALPDPDAVPPRPYVAPRTEAEALVAATAAMLLERDTVGVDDDMFGLGLDSLTATQLVARLLAATGVELSVDVVFDGPTVAAVAAALDRDDTAAGAAPESLEVLLAEVEELSDDAAQQMLGGRPQ